METLFLIFKFIAQYFISATDHDVDESELLLLIKDLLLFLV